MFETLTGDIQGPLEVRGMVKVDGTVRGGAIVSNGRLELRGKVQGPLEVRLDGQADVAAIVEGDVHARGGTLVFRGIITGRLGVKPGADVQVAVGTVLNGRRLEADGSFTQLQPPIELSIRGDAPMMRPQEDGSWAPAA
ncbi:polymer-forming cytoskeletal protein [Geodermatophilus ruber]|uniref:Protein CcmA, bactofilin family n=1 Tax=Geodermatophilus ruber TaxID=504800 RepID=A0A1I4LRG0_9ACTN|nr:polymer-forming cytoskeletal protein [Geodermatophilus ruber]SFL93157.1 hypothetical protein SAMN04488085_12324 [Geodermatophilus ruber]